MKNLFFWLLVAAATVTILYFVADRWFPWIIAKFAGVIVGIFVVITGLFLRRGKKSST